MHGNEPWSSDGTPELWVIDSMAYFNGHDEFGTAQLWHTDGTPLGTEPVVDLSEGTLGAEVIPLAISGRYLLVQTWVFDQTPLWLFDTVTLLAEKVSDNDKSDTPVAIETASGPAFLLKYFDETNGDLLAIIEPKISSEIRTLEQPLKMRYSDMFVRDKEIFLNGDDELHGGEPWCMRLGE